MRSFPRARLEASALYVERKFQNPGVCKPFGVIRSLAEASSAEFRSDT